MPDLTDIDTDALALRATVLADLQHAAGEQVTTLRNELAKRLKRGSKITSFDPRDETRTLGTIGMTNPTAQARITNREEFERWCRLNYPDKVEQWAEYGDPAEVAAVLAEHAPHLLIVHQTVPGEVEEQALKRAVAEDIPGTERFLPRSVLQVRPSKHARTVVDELLAAMPGLPELEA